MSLRAISALLLLLAGPAAAESWNAVAAILEERCLVCHSGDDAPLGLSLDSHAGVTAGSENGAVVDVAVPGQSAILRRVLGETEPRMPLDGPPWLDIAQIATIAAWIERGAPGPNLDKQRGDPDAASAPADPNSDGRITYGEVARIFKQRCIECHSDHSKMGAPPEGLRLTSLAEVLAGGERIVVIPGDPQASELIRRLEGLSDPRMPLDGPPWLEREQIALLRDWIAGGALDDDFAPAPIPLGAEVRLRGTLTGPDEIDGARFTVTGGTRIDDLPAVGQKAEMRGRISADGAIVAERLRDR